MKKTIAKRIEPENLENQIIEFLAKGELAQANTIKAFAELQGIQWPWEDLMEKVRSRASSKPSDIFLPEPLPEDEEPIEKATPSKPAKKTGKKRGPPKRTPAPLTAPRIGLSRQGHFSIRWPDWPYPAVLFLRHLEWFLSHLDEIQDFVDANRRLLEKAQTEETYQSPKGAKAEPKPEPKTKKKITERTRASM